MMSIHRNLTTVCCAAVLALGLAACGSSSDDDSAMMPVEPPMEPPEDPPEDPDQAKMRAEGLAAAIDAAKAEANTTIMATVGTRVPTPMISHSGDAVSVAIGTGTTAYKKAATAPPSIAGWDGSMWTRGTATEHVTLYTNIAAPEAVAFTTANLMKVAPGAGLTINSTNNEVAMLPAAMPSLFKATSLGLPEKGGVSTYTPEAPAMGLTFNGTLGGAMGEYECSGEACTVTVNDKGEVTVLGGAWKFTGAPDAMLLLADVDYLHFGWWVDAMANGKYAFQSFAGVPAYDDPIGAIMGTATYKGASAGLYVLKDVSGGEVTGASSGNFTANATLTASFGDADDVGAISGSISDFMNADGEDLAGWGVTLNAASLVGVSATTPFSSSTRATTGSGTGTGTWQGQFYGPADPTTMQPAGVAGRYDAHFPGAHIAGAFGATR